MKFHEYLLVAGAMNDSSEFDTREALPDLVEAFRSIFDNNGDGFKVPVPWFEDRMVLMFSTDVDDDDESLCLGRDSAMAMLACSENEDGINIPLTAMTLLTGRQGVDIKRECRHMLRIQSMTHHPKDTGIESAYDFLGVRERPAAIVLMDYWSQNADQELLKLSGGLNLCIATAWFERVMEHANG